MCPPPTHTYTPLNRMSTLGSCFFLSHADVSISYLPQAPTCHTPTLTRYPVRLMNGKPRTKSPTQLRVAAVAVADLPLCQFLIKLPRAVEDTRSQRHAHAFPGKLHAHVNIHLGHAARFQPPASLAHAPWRPAGPLRCDLSKGVTRGLSPLLIRLPEPSRAHTHTPLCLVAAE